MKMPKAPTLSPPSPGSGVGGGCRWGKPATPPLKNREKSPAPSDSRGSIAEAKGLLGRTSGVFAAGAWAARMEVARLLESRCNPNDLVDEIKNGVEGLHDLESKMHHTSKSTPDDMSDGQRWSEAVENPLDEEIEKQRAILESITQQQNLPPWASAGTTLTSTGHKTKHSDTSAESGFAKKAVPPPPGFKRDAPSKLEVVKKSDESPLREFTKTAKPPTEAQREEAKGGVPGGERTRRNRLEEDSLAEREKMELETFFRAAKSIFNHLKEAEVVMDLAELTSCPDGGFDEDRFRMHVSPNKARTGMRYARLLLAMFDPKTRDRHPYLEKKEPFERLNCLVYMEAMVQGEVGRRTPQAFLYAVDFFAKAFGFSMGGTHIGRAKRLALRYAQLSVLDRKGAPMFNRRLMETLEKVLDPVVPSPQRIAAGKLRICIQASIRHDDLNSTPLGACEWVRRRGEVLVVGLRARAWKGKTHARAWVCSSLGVKPEHDKWLQALMPLLVDAHGPEWKQHDHLGKMPSGASAESFLARPATIESDVMTVNSVLTKELRKCGDVGLNQDEIDVLRWHGAKATLTNVMQHLNLSPRAVRLSGGWADKHESMGDVYLREAQLLTLRSQERCLLFLRKGGDLGGLVGEPLVKAPKEQGQASSEPGGEAVEAPSSPKVWSDEDVDRGLGNFAMGPADLAEEFLDEVMAKPLPDLTTVEKEKSALISQEEVQNLFSDEGHQLEESPSIPGLPDEEDERDLRSAVVPTTEEAAQEQADEVDSEGMSAFFVQIEKPTQASRVHLPAATRDDVAGVPPLPRCGAKGVYAYLSSSEAIVSPFGVRCFGRPGACGHLCGATIALGAEVQLKCTRRCSCDGNSAEHRCHIHK